MPPPHSPLGRRSLYRLPKSALCVLWTARLLWSSPATLASAGLPEAFLSSCPFWFLLGVPNPGNFHFNQPWRSAARAAGGRTYTPMNVEKPAQPPPSWPRVSRLTWAEGRAEAPGTRRPWGAFSYKSGACLPPPSPGVGETCWCDASARFRSSATSYLALHSKPRASSRPICSGLSFPFR
jgi:hypothetical protein